MLWMPCRLWLQSQSRKAPQTPSASQMCRRCCCGCWVSTQTQAGCLSRSVQSLRPQLLFSKLMARDSAVAAVLLGWIMQAFPLHVYCVVVPVTAAQECAATASPYQRSSTGLCTPLCLLSSMGAPTHRSHILDSEDLCILHLPTVL